jgi:putative transposase
MSLQDNIVKIDILQNLLHAWNSPEDIPKILGIHRATVYRWIKRIKVSGIRQFKKDYKEAKRWRRVHNKTHGSVRTRVLEIRKERKDCCWEKIQYFLRKELADTSNLLQNNLNTHIPSQSTIYRILNANIKLRSRWKKNSYRGDVPKWTKRWEVIQIDTVHFENIFAFTGIDTYTKEPFVQLSTECTSKEWERFIRSITRHYSLLKEPIPIGLIQRDGWPEFKWDCEAYIRRYRNLDGSEIKLRTARPYKKNEQAFIERFNGILRKESLGYANYNPKDLPMLEKEIQSYLHYYLTERPHISLWMIPPMEFIQNLTFEPKETEKQ